MTAIHERTGVLVIRAWVEGTPPQLKARITHTIDVAADDQATTTVASAEEIHQEVRQWLAALQAEPR